MDPFNIYYIELQEIKKYLKLILTRIKSIAEFYNPNK